MQWTYRTFSTALLRVEKSVRIHLENDHANNDLRSESTEKFTHPQFTQTDSYERPPDHGGMTCDMGISEHDGKYVLTILHPVQVCM